MGLTLRVRTVAILSALMGVACSVEPLPEPRPSAKTGMTVKVLARSRPPATPPEPEPGDGVWLTADGDVMAEGPRSDTGEIVMLRLIRRVHVEPSFAVTIREQNGEFAYRYRVSNGKGAKQRITNFRIDAFGPARLDPPPRPWFASINRNHHPIERVFVGFGGRDNDPKGRLVAGASAGEFVVRSQWRPGIVTASVEGHRPLPWEPGYESDDVDLLESGLMSEWLRTAVHKYTSQDSNCVKVSTLGPKHAPGVAAGQAVRAELADAVRMRDFRQDRETLLRLMDESDDAALRRQLEALGGKATGFPADFYEVMLWYLKR